MSFYVNLYNFNKRENSTLAPTGTGTQYNCTLKANTDILAPVLEFTLTSNAQHPTANNYCYIPMFSRYYFIDSWSYGERVWYAHCHVDVLASYKTQIGNQQPYVLRSASASDVNIIDTRYPTRAEYSVSASSIANPFLPPSTEYGVFVLGIASKEGFSGGITYYLMSYLVFGTFISKLYTDGTYNFTAIQTAASEISADLMKTLLNPAQYIVSCRWMPYTIADFVTREYVTSTTTIRLGWWAMSLGVTAYFFTDSTLNISFTNKIGMTIPKHPQTTTRGNYVNLAPYSRHVLRVYPFGVFELDSSKLASLTYLWILTCVDLRTGDAYMILSATEPTGSSTAGFKTTNVLRYIPGKIGVDIPIASVTASLPNLGTTLMIAGASVVNNIAQSGFDNVKSGFLNKIKENIKESLTTNRGFHEQGRAAEVNQGAATAVSEKVSNIASTAIAVQPHVDVIGAQGSFSGYFNNDWQISCVFNSIADEDVEDNGRPLCKKKLISTLSGYIECDSFSPVISSALLNEVEMIANYMVSGFFYE